MQRLAESAERVLTREAFEVAFERAYRTLVAVAISQTDRSQAEDVVQQAAILAWQRRERFTPGTDFAAWMASFVRGAAKNHRRGERRLADRHRRAGLQLTGTHGSSGVETDVSEDAASDGALSEALGRLSDAQRECFMLRVVGERTYGQIGSIVGVPAATARSHVFRARQRLAEMLAEMPVEPEGARDG